MNKGDLLIEKNDMENAMKEYHAAMKMFPDNLEMQYWTAITLANGKEVSKASPMLQKIYAKEPAWRALTTRLVTVGLLNVSPDELKELTR
jgi:predicted Zn-dependent protease